MKGLRAVLDLFTGVLYLVGPGGYELRLSPGSEKDDLHESSMGHLMLPCSEFDPRGGQQSTEVRSFVVGEHFASVATNEWSWNENEADLPDDFWIARKSSAAALTRVGEHSSASCESDPSSMRAARHSS